MSISVSGGGGAVAAPISLVQPSSDFGWFLQPTSDYDTAWSYSGGSYGKTKGWGFWTRNSNSNFTGNRQDNFWGLMYNFSPTSTGSVWADDTEVTAGFRFEDFWLQTVASGTTISGTPSYNAGTGKTTVIASTDIFHGLHVNALLLVSGSLYRISDVDSTTQVKVVGDASAATGAIVVYADYCEWHHIFGYIGQNTSGLNESGQRFVAGQLARQHPWMLWDYMVDKSIWQDSLGVNWMEAKPEWYNAVNGKNHTQPPYGKVSSATYDGVSKTTVVMDRVMFDSSISHMYLRIGESGPNTVERFALTDFVDATSVKISGDQTAKFTAGKRVALIRRRGQLSLTNMYLELGNSAGGIKIKGTDGTATGAVEIDVDNHLYLGQYGRTTTTYMNTATIRPGSTANGVAFGASTDKLGWWGATPVVKGTVTGSRGSNAALASLLTLLASYGLLTDSSS